MQHANRYRTIVARTVCYLGQVGLGCVWIWSSLPKIRRPYDFLGQIYDYELLGAQTGVFVASALPILELILGLCLIAGLLVGGALLVSGALLAGFLMAQGWVLWQGLAISCGCFGPIGEGFISYGTMLRTGGLLAVAVTAYCMYALRCRDEAAAIANGTWNATNPFFARTASSVSPARLFGPDADTVSQPRTETA